MHAMYLRFSVPCANCGLRFYLWKGWTPLSQDFLGFLFGSYLETVSVPRETLVSGVIIVHDSILTLAHKAIIIIIIIII